MIGIVNGGEHLPVDGEVIQQIGKGRRCGQNMCVILGAWFLGNERSQRGYDLRLMRPSRIFRQTGEQGQDNILGALRSRRKMVVTVWSKAGSAERLHRY